MIWHRASMEHRVCVYGSRACCTLADLADLAPLPMGAPSLLLYTRMIMLIVFIFSCVLISESITLISLTEKRLLYDSRAVVQRQTDRFIPGQVLM